MLVKNPYEYKYAGLPKEERALLTKEDDKLHRALLSSHIRGVSFISPRTRLAGGPSRNQVIEAVMCSIYIGSDGGRFRSKKYGEVTNVCSKAEKIVAFCNNLDGIVAIARKLYDGKMEVRVLENPASYTLENNPSVITGNGFKEKFSFYVNTKEELQNIIENFVDKEEKYPTEIKEEKVTENKKEEKAL